MHLCFKKINPTFIKFIDTSKKSRAVSRFYKAGENLNFTKSRGFTLQLTFQAKKNAVQL